MERDVILRVQDLNVELDHREPEVPANSRKGVQIDDRVCGAY
jgi:hypothetical protein